MDKNAAWREIESKWEDIKELWKKNFDIKNERIFWVVMAFAIIIGMCPLRINAQACIKTSYSYDHADAFIDGLARVQRDGKWGFIDKSGKEVIPCVWDDIYYFIDGLALVEQNEKYGFINLSNEVVVPCEFDAAIDFDGGDGIAAVCKSDDDQTLWAIIDNTGKFVTSFAFSEVARDSEGTHVYIDKEDEDGMFRQESYMIDKYGHRIEERSEEKKDLEIVKREGKFGVVNKNNDIVIPFNYDRITQRFGEYYIVEKYDSKERNDVGYLKGLFSSNGKLIIPCKYYEISDFYEGISMVYDGWSYGFTNDRGEIISECKYSKAQPFSEGVAVVRDSKKMGYINTKGEMVIPCQYETAESFHDGWANVENQYYIDKQGKKMMVWCDPKDKLPKLVEMTARITEQNNEYCILPKFTIKNVKKEDIWYIDCIYALSNCPSYEHQSKNYTSRNSFSRIYPKDMVYENGKLICDVVKPEICVEEFDLDKASIVKFSELTIVFFDKNKSKIEFIPKGTLQETKVKVDYDTEKLASKYKHLKEYHGTYRMCGFGYSGNEEFEGYAKYHYKEASDGTRIFEGPFSFSFEYGAYSGECKGSFKNNKQIGRWMWTNTKGEVISSLYFNQSGLLDGDFFIPSSWGTFKNGKLIHLHDYQVIYSEETYTIEGDFSEYRLGIPVGKWTIKGERVPNNAVTVTYDNDGKCIDPYYFEPSTGDRLRVSSGLLQHPMNAYERTIHRLSNRCVRSTEKLDKRK